MVTYTRTVLYCTYYMYLHHRSMDVADLLAASVSLVVEQFLESL